jgi:hypothetical protein
MLKLLVADAVKMVLGADEEFAADAYRTGTGAAFESALASNIVVVPSRLHA